eukprot:7352507-Pyramimonas_sp.AAC.1
MGCAEDLALLRSKHIAEVEAATAGVIQSVPTLQRRDGIAGGISSIEMGPSPGEVEMMFSQAAKGKASGPDLVQDDLRRAAPGQTSRIFYAA